MNALPRPGARAVGRDRAAVQLDQVAHDREPEAEAAARRAPAPARPARTGRRRAAAARARCRRRRRATHERALLAVARAARCAMRSSGARVLRRVGEQVARPPARAASRSPSTQHRRRRQRHVEAARRAAAAAGSPSRRRARRRRAGRRARGCSSILPAVMRDTSSRSSTRRDEVRDLALDDARARAPSARAVAARHQLERGDDRRERVAQLVAEHREELVLGAVGDLGLARASRARRAGATLSSASAARCASSPISAPSSALKRRPDSACRTAMAPMVRPRATSGTTQTARMPSRAHELANSSGRRRSSTSGESKLSR